MYLPSLSENPRLAHSVCVWALYGRIKPSRLALLVSLLTNCVRLFVSITFSIISKWEVSLNRFPITDRKLKSPPVNVAIGNDDMYANT